MNKHYADGTSIWNGYGGEITLFHCGCGQSFVEKDELQAHLASEKPSEAQAEQDAKEVLQPAELSDLNAKLGQTLDQLHAHLVEATCDESYVDGRSDTWREE